MISALRLIFPGALLLAAGPARAADPSAQAERLAALRAEVEALHDHVQDEKDAHRSRLRALEAQKVDLEVQLRRQELRLERLLDDEVALQARIREGSAGSAGVSEAVRAGVASLRAVVHDSLPFKRAERLAALTELEAQLDAASLPPEQVAARLWAFAEDERRLGRENALDRQVAEIDGVEHLVEVVRLGMVAMYWRGPDGTVGQVLPEAGGWRWAAQDEPAAQAQITALFDALGRGIRVGWFTLPNPIAPDGGAR